MRNIRRVLRSLRQNVTGRCVCLLLRFMQYRSIEYLSFNYMSSMLKVGFRTTITFNTFGLMDVSFFATTFGLNKRLVSSVEPLRFLS